MEFFKTSPKDDITSLAYLILYLLNGQELPGFIKHIKTSQRIDSNPKHLFNLVKCFKHNVSIVYMAQKINFKFD